jgi:HTH-type transcriptional regulator/antitoxin HigA
MNKENKKFKSDIAIHPGESLRELIEEINLSQKELADRMGITPKTVNEIINGKTSLTSENAIKLERIFGISATFCNNL